MKTSFRIFIFSLIALLLSGIHGQGGTSLHIAGKAHIYNNVHAVGQEWPVQQTGFKSTQIPNKVKIAIRIKALQNDCHWFVASELSFSYPFPTIFCNTCYGSQACVQEHNGIYTVRRLRGPPTLRLA